MMNQSPPELFAERPIRSELARGISYRMRRILTVSLVAVFSLAGLYTAFKHNAPAQTVPQIPVITAEGSYKEKPKDAGGIDIPHQDVQVYQELNENNGSAQPIEHLLPAPETPKPAPVTVETQSTSMPAPAAAPENLRAVAMDVAAPAIVTTVAPSAPAAAAPEAIQPAPVVASAPAPQIAAIPSAKKPAPVHTVAKSLATSAGSKISPVVQLASVSDMAAAESMAGKLQDKYSAFLGGVKLHVTKADLGAKGTFYRIQSQPVSSDMASQICAALQNHNAGCLIVRH